MSPDRGRTAGPSRFTAVLLGAVGVSLIWVVVLVLTSTTPDQARERREAPDLPPPSVTVEKRVLDQVSWYDCDRSVRSVKVEAPAAPPGTRSVVTSLAGPHSKVETGTVLASVAGEPLVGIVTGGVFYRDLEAGAEGRDVLALTTAMTRAGWITRASDRLGFDAVAAWQRKTGLDASTIRWRNLVAVPPAATVGAAEVAVGDPVKQGQAVLTVTAQARAFTCDVADPDPSLTARQLRFEVAGADAPVARIVVHVRDGDSPGAVEVTPAAKAAGESARLGIETGGTAEPVLAVPLGAVRTAADGSAAVVVLDGRRSREVEVRLGASAQGWVELLGTDLEPGTTLRLFGPAARDSAGS
ncbi:MAG: hypothetical protein J7518_10265 [Nocardioidaceae bacterium]|nr:hypothetical protein [Nocardioidaceae bacterium]